MTYEPVARFKPGQRVRAEMNITSYVTIKKEIRPVFIPKDRLGIFVRYSDVPDQYIINFDGIGQIEANESWITDEV
jgi:hypothetical protein